MRLIDQISHWNFRRIEECATLIDWLDARAGERILDVGCGDGFYDSEIARSGASVVGIDVHDRRLAIANRRHCSARTEFMRLDAEQMPLPDASFDKAVSFCVIEHFRDDDRVLRNLHRVLRAGGRLVLSADSLTNREVRDDEREAHRRRYAVNNFYTVETLGEKLARAGFELEQTRYILTTPLTLALARLSWRLDDLPEWVAPAVALGYLALGTVGKVASDLSEKLAGDPSQGLTLLARARRV